MLLSSPKSGGARPPSSGALAHPLLESFRRPWKYETLQDIAGFFYPARCFIFLSDLGTNSLKHSAKYFQECDNNLNFYSNEFCSCFLRILYYTGAPLGISIDGFEAFLRDGKYLILVSFCVKILNFY